ncbi:transporter substrate-binding domain-containing protein [Vibrio sp. SCSIO 43135]|uniref:substrate-binding periplasmic protein n=1 Tax=Vibrio sp. SCSIO 43135 TaxID=2819096 RepID=UPI0020753BF4|nr:transporter substrate-binding domain-containing protein [Vibrio sp. SCSIO 43135]USD43822.1 transporter substrate-binding domain-containing protein [Vibrio sp. SCSIO 43135]
MQSAMLNTLLLMLLIGFSFSAQANSLSGKHLTICGDAIDWPPYTYVHEDMVKGVDVEVLKLILPKHDISYEIIMTSWARCLKGAAMGQYDIALSASYSEERSQYYLYTDSYYSIRPLYIYSELVFPDAPPVKQQSDLYNYRVCGIFSYNYADFKLDASAIEQNTHSVFETLQEIKYDHCDVFLMWHEILDGFERIWDVDYTTNEFQVAEIADLAPHKFYMMVSKKNPQAESIKTLLNIEIGELKESGELDKIIQSHLK